MSAYEWIAGRHPERGPVMLAGAVFRRGQRTTARVLGATSFMDAAVCGPLIALGLAGSVLLGYAVGGVHVAAPHWFYLPIILAAVRFGPVGALVTAVAAAFLAGPVLPYDVATGERQAASDWVTRGAFFVLVGQAFAFALLYTRHSRQLEFSRVRADRALRRALANDEFRIHYQPLVDLQGPTPRIVSAEALLRWSSPRSGLVEPGGFIPLAEETGLILPITQWLLERACDQRRAWAALVPDDEFVVSVNISAAHLEIDTLVTDVNRVLAETGVRPEHLELEITETAAMRDIEHTIELLHALRETGVRIALDDFGTGHASLSYLSRLPVHSVKIDRSFVAPIGQSTEAATLVQSVVLLARTQGLRTVAEGVETAAQYDLLREMRCDRAQGFYFSRPRPVEEFTTLLRTGVSTAGLGPLPRPRAPRRDYEFDQ